MDDDALDMFSMVPSVFRTNGVLEGAEELMKLYAEMEEASISFTSRFDVTCPPACGTCCEHFVPAITDSEATLVALYLLYVKPEQRLFDALYSGDQTEACPLYDADDPHHCQVYPVRPVVCRSFNSLPSRDKNGNLRFRSCRFTDKGTEKRVLDHAQIAVLEEVRSMSDFGSSLALSDASSDAESLPRQVVRQLSKLLLIQRFSQEEKLVPLTDDDDDDVPPQDVAV